MKFYWRIFFVVFAGAGLAAFFIDGNWVGGLILIGISLFPIIFGYFKKK